jgi:septal ring factor EnvC (AmiA/AmiB activator)
MSFFDPAPETTDNAQAPASEANPSAQTTAPAAKPEATEPTPSTLDSDAVLDADLDQEATEPEDAELEYEGKKFKVPKDLEPELKNALLRHGDYTRKTQEVAEQRKQIETAKQQFEQTAQLHQALIDDIAQVRGVDARLAQLQRMDLASLSAQDPQRAQALLIELSQLQAARGQLLGSLTQKQQQMQSARQQELAKRTDEARAFLMREFRDWSPEKDQAMEAYTRSKGVNTQALGQFLAQHPQVARVIDDGMKYRQSLEKRAAARAKPEPPPKPVTRVGGAAASNTKSPSDMTPQEYAVWRRERTKR